MDKGGDTGALIVISLVFIAVGALRRQPEVIVIGVGFLVHGIIKIVVACGRSGRR